MFYLFVNNLWEMVMSRIMSDGAERKGSACVAGDSGEKDGDSLCE